MYVSAPGRQPWGRRHHRRPWLVACIIAVLVGWGVWTAVELLGAARDAQRAVDIVRVGVSAGVGTDDATVRSDLASARELLVRSRRSLDSPVTVPLRYVPVVGRHFSAVRTSLVGAVDAVDAVDAAVGEFATTLRSRPAGERTDPATLSSVAATAEDLNRRLAAIRLPDSRRLVGPVRRQVKEFSDGITRLRDATGAGGEALRAGAELLGGPRRCLAVAANNAEMRNGSGMPLGAASVTVADGRVNVGAFRSFDDIAGPGAVVPVDADLQATWGYLQPGAEIRNQSLTARHDASASALASLWSARTGEPPVDCIVTIDAVGLAAILKVVGPVTVDGRTFGADAVTDWVIRGQYAEFGRNTRQARQDAAGSLAAATVGRLLAGNWDPVAMFRALDGAARRRAVMVWSARPEEQRAWRRAGIAGTLDDDALALAVVNRGPDKLDPYLRVTARLDVDDVGDAAGPSPSRKVTLTVDVTNTAKGDEPRYVLGPDANAPAAEAARYSGYVVVRSPSSWADATVVPPGQAATAGPDGNGRVIAATVAVAPGATQQTVFTFTIPGDQDVTVMPSARVPGIDWRSGSQMWRDERPRKVRL